MNDTTLIPWDMIKGVFSFLSVILLGFGAWWGKTINEQVGKLQDKAHDTEVTLVSLTSGTESREKLQDERWRGLRKDIESIQNNVAALVAHNNDKK